MKNGEGRREGQGREKVQKRQGREIMMTNDNMEADNVNE